MKYRVVVCGGLSFTDQETCFTSLDRILDGKEDIEIVSGHARGADALGEKYAMMHSLELTVFKADWKRYGRGAGPIRNKQMVDYAKAEHGIVVAFWNGTSRGTRNTIELARKAGLEIHIISYESKEFER